MTITERTSADAHDRHIRGRLIASSNGQAWKDVLVQILSRLPLEESVLVPAVAEPLIVWILSGKAMVEERDIGGAWTSNEVEVGDFFLTTSPAPYEMRWKATGPKPFEVMHLYLGLPIFDRAAREILGEACDVPVLREVSGERDHVLSLMLEHFRIELTSRHQPSALFVQGIAQSLAVHLVRHYRDPKTKSVKRRSALPAFKLRKVTELLEKQLGEEFNLARLAEAAGLSEFHFSRQFKKATSFSPSQYLIRLRMAEARRLLRETDRSVIDIGLDVGYSSPSHFGQIFRREVGVSPTDYRG